MGACTSASGALPGLSTVRWYNIGENVSFLEWHRDDPLTKLVKITPGLYGYRDLKAALELGESDVTLEAGIIDGIVELMIGEGWELNLPRSLTTLLGIGDEWSDRWIVSKTYVGECSLDFVIPKMIFVHLDQMNMSANYVDGAPSTLLQAIPAGRGGYDDIEDFAFPHPLRKPLECGTISELKLSLLDKNNRPIDNNGLAVVATLEITESVYSVQVQIMRSTRLQPVNLIWVPTG